MTESFSRTWPQLSPLAQRRFVERTREGATAAVLEDGANSSRAGRVALELAAASEKLGARLEAALATAAP